MNKPNRYIDLTKTNYFANLKRKSSAKDGKEQANFNKEILNCISILEGRIVKLESTVADRIEKVEGALSDLANHYNEGYSALCDYINREIVPYVNEIHRDVLDKSSLENDENDGVSHD